MKANLSRCLAIVVLSIIVPEDGNVTGSLIKVPISGSRYLEGASCIKSSSANCSTTNPYKKIVNQKTFNQYFFKIKKNAFEFGMNCLLGSPCNNELSFSHHEYVQKADRYLNTQ